MSLYAVETARIRVNPKIIPGVTHASAPPVTSTSASPCRMSDAAYPMASVELVQPVEITWLTPRSPSAIEISLDTIPTIDTGIA